MKNLSMMLALLVAAAGCGQLSLPKVIVVTPLDQQDILDAKAAALIAANTITPERQPDDSAVTECLCGGTGRSGDGLGPCACPDGCQCKSKRSGSDQEPEDEPVFETQEEPVAASEDGSSIDETNNRVAALEQQVALLTDGQARIEEQIAEMAKGAVKNSAQNSMLIKNQCVVMKKGDGSCPPCERFTRNEVPKLLAVGWKVGKAATDSVVLVDIDSPDADQWPDAKQNANVSGYPYYAFYQNGEFAKGYAGFTTAAQLADDFNATLIGVQKQQAKPVSYVLERLPVIQHPQWGQVDLETYRNDGCGCAMCVGIRSMQADLRSKRSLTYVDTLPAAQQPTPDELADNMLSAMALRSDDVLADLGCGDARILIKAANRYRCRGIGVEIDPEMAERARENVRIAGLDDRIEIITGDVQEFDPKRHGVTAMTAYLYPELLQKLSSKFRDVRISATLYHKVNGLSYRQQDNVFLYENKPVIVSGAAQPVTYSTTTSSSSCRSGCPNGRCGSSRRGLFRWF